MKIRGGSPFVPSSQTSSTSQAARSSKTGKTKEAKKSSSLENVAPTSSVSSAETVERLDLSDPVFHAMSEASRKMTADEASLQEATRAVVSAVIREHFGKTNLSDREIDQISQAVSLSVEHDSSLRDRLETVLRRIAKADTRRSA